ncbi:protein Spindly [Dunckerocampus dactyliophorus]|uniref:protein Spindly n=1 Tax=Dunckerocampus dactyliophorus TaxID=161453 RepID=UPI002406FEDC|nr:protein Spindly [Dunckerocampus dactyliophorus]XP_054648781.1 protein Spindly [Dunckerocampus dactyliophorus]
MSNTATEDEIQHLRCQLRQKEEQVQQAASAGLDLLNQLAETQTRLEEQRIEMTSALEGLEQDKYSLQKEVELKTRVLDSLQSEFDHLKKQQRQSIDEEKAQLQRSHKMTLNDLHSKMLGLKSSLDESRLIEKQLKEKLDVQTNLLHSKMEECRVLNEQPHSSSNFELLELQDKVLELENVKLELKKALTESQYREQQLQLTNGSLQHNVQQITEESNKDIATWYKALEKSREANRELQIQLDGFLQQAQDPDSKGNSLFAELEDKRAEMERKLISMKVQYESLQTQHAFNKQQLQHMKIQIATLMQLQGSRADPSQLERLQSMLSEKNEEIHHLMSKLQKLEKLQTLLKTQESNLPPVSDGQDETYYTDLLKMKLDNTIKDVQRLGDELSLQRMKSLSESQKALELERKLFTSERLVKKAQSDKIRLQLRVEELQHKYEPKERHTYLSKRTMKEKLPTDTVPPSEKSALEKDKQTVSKKTSITPAMIPETDTSPTAAESLPEDFHMEPKAAKCAKICEDDLLFIPNPSSNVTDCSAVKREDYQEQHTHEESKRKAQTVETIHVGSKSSMESQCSQQ